MRRVASGVLWICFALGVMGVTAQDAVPPPAVAPESAEARVKARVESFWTAKKGRQLDVCYDMLNQASRKNMTMVDYIRRNNTRIIGYTIETVQIDPNDSTRALAEVRCDLHAMGRKVSNVRSRQRWILEENVWRCVYTSRSPFDQRAEQSAEPASEPKGGITDAEIQKQREVINRIRQKYGLSPSLAEVVNSGSPAPVSAAGQPATTKTDGAAASGQKTADGKTKPGADDETKTAEGAAADKAKPAPATQSGTSTDKQKKDPPPGI